MDKARPLPRVQSIHNPVLKGKVLLLLPEGLLVRWPERVPMPLVGEDYAGDVVRVPDQPEHLRETVLAVLFAETTLTRCDAVRRLAANKHHRRTILQRLFSRGYVQKMLASAERLQPEQRRQLAAQGKNLSVRRLIQATSAPGIAPAVDEAIPPSKM